MIEPNFLRNVWYVAGWQSEFDGVGPFARQIIGEQVVLFRKTDGTLVALQDRCPHRWAPLSLGRVEGDDLRCMYHGLKLDAGGVCVEVPDQDKIATNLCVATYPVVERHRFAWIWMGDHAKADPALIPSVGVIETPGWHLNYGSLDYQANYALVNDNLLDLSHTAYTHEQTFGRLPQLANGKNARLMERGVRNEGWAAASEFKEGLRPVSGSDSDDVEQPNQRFGDTFGRIDYVVPGIYHSFGATYAPGTGDRCNGEVPGEDEVPLTQTHSVQAVTPMTASTSRYFFSACSSPGTAPPEAADAYWENVVKVAFNEDLAMIEAQQRNIERFPGEQMGGIAADRGFVLFRRLMARLMAEETSQ